jgi:hypothetical protein
VRAHTGGLDSDPTAGLVVRATVERPAAPWPVRRTGPLTPYLVQLIHDDVRHAGPDAVLEVRVPPRTRDGWLRDVARLFDPLAARGAIVRVVRDHRWRPASLKLHGRAKIPGNVVWQAKT